jgi:Kef-type K+ transport system membrane component KefB
MSVLDFIRLHASALPDLVKFALAMAIIVGIPALFRPIKIPGVVGLLLTGVVIGPHGVGLFAEHHPVIDFLAELGKLLLMFSAGLEIDLALFRRAQRRSMIFGLLTTLFPLLLGTVVGLWCGYQLVSAVVIGSLLASHTLLAASILLRLGATRIEPIVITVGATVMSDTLSLIVFAICASTYHSGFSVSTLAVQLIEIAIFVPLILFGLSRLGAYLLKRLEADENSYFVVMMGIMGVAAVLARSINLPGIVGAFLAGLAVNAAVQEKPAKQKLEFFGNSLFIPVFFVATGFLIDPVVFFESIVQHFPLTAGIILALLVGKWVAAEIAVRAFKYSRAARRTMWSLTLPQVAATLAAALVAFDTFNPAGQRLVDAHLLNAVLVLMLTTSILGPILTERFAPLLLREFAQPVAIESHKATDRGSQIEDVSDQDRYGGTAIH